MEHHNIDCRGIALSSTNGPIDALTLITWGYRLLYLLQFISIIVTMGRVHLVYSLGFLIATFCILFSVISAKKDIFEPWDFSYLLEEE